MDFLIPAIIMGGVSLVLGLLLALASRFLTEYGRCRIIVNGERELQVQGGDTLLALLFSNGIFIPSACGGRGTCGYCKVRVAKGGGPLLSTERPYLSADEIDRSVRLSCQVKVKTDMEVGVPKEYLAIRRFMGSVAATRSLTHEIKEVRLRLEEPGSITFEPGQYIQLEVPDEKGPPVYRAYSISSTPSKESEVELIVRLVPGGIGSTYVHNLNDGDHVSFTGPYGEMKLRDTGNDILCVGGGVGIAPLKSIVMSLLEQGTTHRVLFYLGVRAKKDLMYMEEFRELSRIHPNFRFVFALSSPLETDQWDGDTGFIHLLLERDIEDGRGFDVYLCGPPVMADAVIKVLKEKGVPEDRIYYDKF